MERIQGKEGSQEEGVQYVVVFEWNNDSATVVLSSCSSYTEMLVADDVTDDDFISSLSCELLSPNNHNKSSKQRESHCKGHPSLALSLRMRTHCS